MYQIKIDNNQDALADVIFQFRFQTHILDAGLPCGFVGAGNGINAPANSPAPVAPGTPIVPPAITSLTGAGAAGLSLQQTFTVDMIKGGTTHRSHEHDRQPVDRCSQQRGPAHHAGLRRAGCAGHL